MNLPEKVTIIEVGPRDGLQNEQLFVDTQVKKAFIKKLAAAGVRKWRSLHLYRPSGFRRCGMQRKLFDHVPLEFGALTRCQIGKA